jgi:hypothetical protein
MKRRNESRQWVWPFGKKKKAAKSARKVSPKAVEAKAKERESERLERKLSDRDLEAKLRKHYARGGNLREFLTANPGVPGEQFKRCVAAVSEKGGAYDPRAVCAAAGRKRYGAKKYAALAKAGRKRAKRGNPTKNWYDEVAQVFRSSRDQGMWAVAIPGSRVKLAKTKSQALALARVAVTSGRATKVVQRNPAEAAAEVYEEFHGRPSEEVVTVTEKIHYHKNLAALGELRTLVVVARDGGRVTLSRFKKAILCTNEAKNQMFIRGGDQSVDPGAFGIRNVHEVETLGKVVELAYFTRKDHLGDEGGEAIYFHVAGETNENGKRKMAGWAPDLIYHTIDERLEFSGGSYTIRAEGVDK